MRVAHFGEPMAGTTGPMPWVGFQNAVDPPEEDELEDDDDHCPKETP